MSIANLPIKTDISIAHLNLHILTMPIQFNDPKRHEQMTKLIMGYLRKIFYRNSFN